MSEICKIILYSCLIIGLTSFVIHLMEKWGIRNWLVSHSWISIFSKMVGCDLCLSFWLSLVCTLIFCPAYWFLPFIINSLILKLL